MPCDEYNFNKSSFRIRIGGKQQVITRVLDTIRLYLVNKTNRNQASVLEVISGDSIILPLSWDTSVTPYTRPPVSTNLVTRDRPRDCRNLRQSTAICRSPLYSTEFH